MLKLQMRRGLLPPEDQTRFDDLLETLREKWQPLIRPLQNLQCESFGLEHASLEWGSVASRALAPGDSELLIGGEVFRVQDGLIVVALGGQESGGRVRFREDDKGNIYESNLDDNGALRVEVSALVHAGGSDVLDEVSRVASEVLGVELEGFKYEHPRFDGLKKEVVAEELPDSPTHLKAARALLPRVARTLAVAVKSARGILASDAQRHVPDGLDATSTWDSLLSSGVLERDVVIVCNTTKEQVARVPDEDSIEELTRVGLRCACGRPIEEERSEHLYTVTDVGRVLLDKSRWMSVLVRDELMQLGVDQDDILLECQIGSDEIDCIAQISGEIAIFELKDKDFSIGNAYSFGAKMSIFNGEHAVIVSTESISQDVKEHFNRTRSTDRRSLSVYYGREPQLIHYIEGPEFLDSISPIVSKIYSKDGGRILDKALALGLAKSSKLIKALEM